MYYTILEKHRKRERNGSEIIEFSESMNVRYEGSRETERKTERERERWGQYRVAKTHRMPSFACHFS